MRLLLALCTYEDWTLRVAVDQGGRPFMQWLWVDRCKETGAVTQQAGRKWWLSYHMTDSELVQTAFKAVLTAVEHEAREAFRYRDRAIFGPHYNVDKLVELYDRNGCTDARAVAGE